MQSLILMLYSRWICLGKERIRRINNATFTIKNSLTQSLRSVKDTQCLSGISIPPRGGGVFFLSSSPPGRASTPMGRASPPWGGKVSAYTQVREKRSASTQMQKNNRRQRRCREKVGVYSDAGKRSASTQMQDKISASTQMQGKVFGPYLGTPNCLIGKGLNTKSGHVKQCHDTPGWQTRKWRFVKIWLRGRKKTYDKTSN